MLKSKQIYPFIQVCDEEDLEKVLVYFFFFFYPVFDSNTKGKSIN